MAILGGSPLGLIGITSNPLGGYSTFNGGKSRNVSVSSYNKSNAGSLFTGRRRLRAWPNIKQVDGGYDTAGFSDVDFAQMRKNQQKPDGTLIGDNYTQKSLHNNDVYDTSILNIIEKLAPTKAALRPSDFAYLKNIGVYPNNRLMIARRFAGPVDDNIMVNKNSNEIPSLANIITWVSDEENFIEIEFGEFWQDAKADFTGFLNSLGQDFGKSKGPGLGDILGMGGGVIPLPGFTEIFQRQFLKSIGLLDDTAASGIPAGNPNLIKEAKVRKTIGYDSAGSGLMAKVSFKFSAEYELKFISGIDPSIVWMDIIGMVLRFGTSDSSNYGLSKSYATKIKGWVNKPNNLIDAMIAGIKDAVNNAANELTDAINKIYDTAVKAANSLSDTPPDQEKEISAKAAGLASADSNKKDSLNLIDKLKNIGNDVIRGTILKYRTEIIGIVNALTGMPSTPWHITIGNPLRPIFCSGDMLTQNVKITMGPQLAFNDLPSSIKIDFTLENARNLGMQEIAAKFNSGYLRTVDVQKTFYETNQVVGKDGTPRFEDPGFLPYVIGNGDGTTNVTQSSSSDNSINNTGNGSTSTNTQAIGSTKVSGNQQQLASIVKDPKKPQI